MKKEIAAKHLPPIFRWSYLTPKYWLTWIMLGSLMLIANLPMRINFALGRGLGWLLYHVVPSRKRITDTNLRLCFPELDADAREQMVRRIIESCGIGFFESAMALWGPTKRLRSCHSITGVEHLQAAHAAGKGVLLVGTHMTTIDICGRMVAFHANIDVVYRQDPNLLIAYVMVKARERFYANSVISNETRKLVRNLQAGHIVWYAPDQDHGIKHSIFAPFFGITAATVPGCGRFAKLGNAQVMMLGHFREADGSYRIEISPPWENFPSGDDLADSTRSNKMIEGVIRQKPDQYLWVHRRFKTRPAGEESFYKKRNV